MKRSVEYPFVPEFTPVVQQDGDWWIGWIEEVPGVNCQEDTFKALVETLVVTLKEALELSREDCLSDWQENVAQPSRL